MTSDGNTTIFAIPRAKPFRYYINALKEVDEGDDFVSEWNGDVRSLFYLSAEKVWALDLNLIRALEVLEKETQNVQMQMLDTRGRAMLWVSVALICCNIFFVPLSVWCSSVFRTHA